MDWNMNGYVPFSTHHQDEVEDEEDFYGPGQNSSVNGDSDAIAGAAKEDSKPSTGQLASFFKQQSTAPQMPTVGKREIKTSTETGNKPGRAEELRAKLLAKRAASSRPATPAKTPVKAPSPAPQQKMEQNKNNDANGAIGVPQDDAYGIQSLLAEAEGKAAAEAKVARDNQAASNRNGQPEKQQPVALEPGRMDVDQPKRTPVKDVRPVEKTWMQRAAELRPELDRQQELADKQQQELTTKQQPEPTENQIVKTTTNQQPTQLNDPYYDDLSVWLEFTGYHDVAFRNSKLATYKERKQLEKEYARIALALEKLKETEKADLESLRPTAAHSVPAPMAPPPLPTTMPSPNGYTATNGAKRPHSPDLFPADKVARRAGQADSGFRIRGADEAFGPTPPRRGRSPLDRRLSFPDRRRSFAESQDRDPSLERRQRNYKREDEPFGNGRADTYAATREPPRQFNNGRQRDGAQGFNNGNRSVTFGNGPSNYRGSAGLDLRKGGVRYFMIKSWNHENVLGAMNDSLWATQEKNEQLLTEAFHTSRHVILLYSVNKSMAFQGYALMTSPPDPSLPKPPFCTKLNWKTSPAFTIRWLATTPVHFRMVGHLKNTCNPDEEGVPRAVLVGKDGQEISQEAGMGVVWILDEVEEEARVRV